MGTNLDTKIGPINLAKPTMLASGILGISLDVFKRIHDAGAGAIVTKSLSKEPWDGYPNPTIFSVKGDGWLNAVGLSNPGAPYFAKMISSNKNIPIIVSLVGSTETDFEFMIKQFENCLVTAYELNLSCPHVEKVGLEVGDDPELVKKIIKGIKSVTDVPIIAKIGLGTTHYLETVGAEFGWKRMEIHVASEYRRGTCEYNAVLDHENQHVSIIRIALSEYAPRVRAELERELGRLPPMYTRNPQTAADRAVEDLYGRMQGVVDRFQRSQANRHGAIDSSSNYGAIADLCPNWDQNLAGAR